MKAFIIYFKKSLMTIIFLGFITVLIASMTNAIPILTQKVFDEGILKRDINSIVIFTAVLIIIYLSRSILNYMSDFLLAKTSSKVIADIKTDMIHKTMNMPMSFFDSKSTAYILSRINEANSLSSIFTPTVFVFFSSSISMIGALIYIFSKSILIFIICIVFIPLVYIISNGSLSVINKYSKEMFETNARTNNKIHSTFEGIVTLKQLNQEKNVNEIISKEVFSLAEKTVKQSKTISKSSQLLTVVILIIQSLIIGVIAYLITKERLKIGDYVALTQYVGMVYVPITMFQGFKITIQPALAAISRLNSLIEKTFPENKGIKVNEIKTIVLKNVSFKYETAQKEILKNINLEINTGEKLALIGSNGSGKTTIVKLLLGFYQNYLGNIYINGIELKKINIRELRDRIGIIPQNIYLFENTIADNIKIGNTKITEKEFQQKINLLKKQGILADLDLNKKIIENGKNLSKGQIQQIAFARAFMKNFDVLIFDEATSNMDKNARKAFKEILSQEFSNKICIFISHDNELSNFIDKKFVLLEDFNDEGEKEGGLR
ncbi:peptidase domain-containing ABC transporter [Bacillus thuringiensis]|uniref:peptidase domain-containing ABC transporter n=1 Tax=Bacillus thuringiensis TaxID=1428 RepID=UPI001D02E5AC|nr:ABC transporter ATP-binding protein [Bacillus thuringiensis]